MTPTIKIIKNSCSETYLNMFRTFIPNDETTWDNEQVAEEDYAKINLSKLNLIENSNYKNPLLAGIAIGLLTQIYEAGGKDYFIPEVHFCGISLKDKNTPINYHTDNWDKNKGTNPFGQQNLDLVSVTAKMLKGGPKNTNYFAACGANIVQRNM